MDMLVPKWLATRPAARQRPRRDAENGDGEVSWRSLPEILRAARCCACSHRSQIRILASCWHYRCRWRLSEQATSINDQTKRGVTVAIWPITSDAGLAAADAGVYAYAW